MKMYGPLYLLPWRILARIFLIVKVRKFENIAYGYGHSILGCLVCFVL